MWKLVFAAVLISLGLVLLFYATAPRLVEFSPNQDRISYLAFEQVDDLNACRYLAEESKSVLGTATEYDCGGQVAQFSQP